MLSKFRRYLVEMNTGTSHVHCAVHFLKKKFKYFVQLFSSVHFSWSWREMVLKIPYFF
jgi:hypothetical protein